MDLNGTSFSVTPVERKPRVILSIEGLEQTGKSHFSFSAPGPMAYFGLDYGDEGVIEKWDEVHKERYGSLIAKAYYKVDPGDINRASSPAMEKHYTQLVEKFRKDYASALTWARTVVMDTFDAVWSMFRLGRFGRLAKVPSHLYDEINAEFRDIVTRPLHSSRTNLILVHKLEAEWESYFDEQGKERRRKTGQLIRTGFKDIGFAVQVYLRMSYTASRNGTIGVFRTEVLKCRDNAQFTGTVWDNVDFPTLMSILVPGKEWDK